MNFRNVIIFKFFCFKIYRNKSKEDWTKYDLEIPKIDLTEPLTRMVRYIYHSIKNKKNDLFKDNLNEKITFLLDKINKIND